MTANSTCTTRDGLDELIGAARHEAAEFTGPDDASSASGPGAHEAPWRPPAPECFRGYQIVREIHRGGQGIVYQAVHEATERDVAIKVLRDGVLATPRELVRFEREVSILREFEHPNVVTVLDVGAVGDQPYIVMPYVQGRPLDAYVAEQGLELRETLELFAIVCDAVSAAHLRGVIHRDIKPSNIRVDDHGRPYVLDFGLAKLYENGLRGTGSCGTGLQPVNEKCGTGLQPADSECGTGFQPLDGKCGTGPPRRIFDFQPVDEKCGTGLQPVDSECGTGLQPVREGPGTGPSRRIFGFQPADDITLTESGQFIGSLPWSSPEQAADRHGDTDVRTDVYSLGVVLFRLLTDKFPYETSGSMRDVLDRIIEASPVRPRTLSRQIDVDVETIILKCLSKDRQRRYQSAGELAADVRRYLAGEAIEARRESFTYVAWRFVRRNRLSSGLAAALVLSLLTGVLALVTLWRDAVTQRDRATANARDADEAIIILTEEIRQQPMEDGAGYVAKRSEALGAIVQRLDAMGSERPGVQWRVRRMLALEYLSHQDREAALIQSGLALEMAHLAFGPGSDEVASESFDHGWVLVVCGDPTAAARGEELIRNALAMLPERGGQDDEKRPMALGRLARAAGRRGDSAEFDRLMTVCMAIARAMPDKESQLLAHTLKSLGDELDGMDRHVEAARVKEEAMALYEAATAVDAETMAHAQHSLAVTLRKLGRLDEAEPLARKAWQTRKTLYGPDHWNAMYPAVSAGNLGIILTRQGRLSEAEPLLLEANDLCSRSRWSEQEREEWGSEIVGFLVELYETWDAAEPGTGYAEEAEHWRTLPPHAAESAVEDEFGSAALAEPGAGTPTEPESALEAEPNSPAEAGGESDSPHDSTPLVGGNGSDP